MKKISDKRKQKLKKNSEVTKQLHSLFREIWDECEDEYGICYCFETGKELSSSNRMLTTTYHHVLPKNLYKELTLVKENIVILHPDVHELAEKDLDNTPKVKKLQEILIEKYGKRD